MASVQEYAELAQRSGTGYQTQPQSQQQPGQSSFVNPGQSSSFNDPRSMQGQQMDIRTDLAITLGVVTQAIARLGLGEREVHDIVSRGFQNGLQPGTQQRW